MSDLNIKQMQINGNIYDLIDSNAREELLRIKENMPTDQKTYSELDGKPTINGVIIDGNLSLEDLGITIGSDESTFDFIEYYKSQKQENGLDA